MSSTPNTPAGSSRAVKSFSVDGYTETDFDKLWDNALNDPVLIRETNEQYLKEFRYNQFHNVVGRAIKKLFRKRK